MNRTVDIALHYVTRIEGHGNIYVKAKNGTVEKCEWNIPEAPRFFEAMVMGRKWNELHHITSRICGICSIGHTLASLKATEAAMDIPINEQDLNLRKLALHAENMQSHMLHLGYLVLPDLLGAGSIIPLTESHPDEIKTVIRLHRLANHMSDIVCGRTTHPQRLLPGGFSKIPTTDELKTLKKKLHDSQADLNTLVNLFQQLVQKFPDFWRETEFIALTSPDEYALYDGVISSTDTESAPVTEYLSFTNEYIVPTSTAKQTKHVRDSCMVGALARFNKNYEKLLPRAKEVAALFDLNPVCHNPFMNNIAQLVEIVHSVEDSIRLISLIEDSGLEPLPEYNRPEIQVKAGRGVGAVEVPRGILFHDYTYNEEGVCTTANCVIPTNQNHGNIQRDLEAFVPQLLGKPQKEIELAIEMLVRAYDPCISCSTHYLEV
ncbi:MAG: Ni/Fe hydrogenase subunit alpha [Theionarchaea archaeon]|nr:MAG: hydrogenase/sulfur reductase subunit alpha [Theionarchaea archaeon DG-70-1]MBU7028126.1 Ni/Fe hydrogenase subunit alpha [Theionarchaea archaeon]